jgi:hypothetical protein
MLVQIEGYIMHYENVMGSEAPQDAFLGGFRPENFMIAGSYGLLFFKMTGRNFTLFCFSIYRKEQRQSLDLKGQSNCKMDNVFQLLSETPKYHICWVILITK